jgi:chromate transporter
MGMATAGMSQPGGTAAGSDALPDQVTLSSAFRVWCRVAALSFGGPAGQISVMHRILVEEKKWISEERFLHALSYCMLLPGPEAQQLATYTGWLMHGTRGALMAGILFILPGYVSMMLLSILYAVGQQTFVVSAIFFGLKPAVLAVVLEAVVRISRRALKNRVMYGVAAASFLMIFLLKIPFPVIIVSAGLFGLITERLAPHWVVIVPAPKLAADGSTPETSLPMDRLPQPTLGRALRISAVCLTLWFGPLLVVRWLLPGDSVFLQEGLFFSKAAVVTFGGAYAVLGYIAQQAVDRFGWLQSGEMLDGLGMAETTPGPLIMVVQFVGFMGAFRHPEGLSPVLAGFLGATLTTWVTFVPCFYWIFLGAPWIETLRGSRRLNAALSCITAAVLGVVVNMSVWFAAHTLFTDVRNVRSGWLHFIEPVWSTFQPAAAGISVVAFLMTFVFHCRLVVTLAVCCGLGFLIKLAGFG